MMMAGAWFILDGHGLELHGGVLGSGIGPWFIVCKQEGYYKAFSQISCLLFHCFL